MCDGLSVFPITAIEGMLFASPLVVAHLVAGVYGSSIFPFSVAASMMMSSSFSKRR